MDSTKKLRMYRSHAMGIHAPRGLSAARGSHRSTFQTCHHLPAKPSSLITVWPYLELELSHIKPASLHRTKSAPCAAERSTERWGGGNEAEERHRQLMLWVNVNIQGASHIT